MTNDTKEEIFTSSLNELAIWRVRNQTLSLYFLNHEAQFITSEARAISRVLSSYVQFNLQNKQRKRKSPSNETTPPKRERLRQLRIMLYASYAFENNESLPNSKTNPVYINPNQIHVNPLFSGEKTIATQFYDEKAYYAKMIRSLIGLKSNTQQHL